MEYVRIATEFDSCFAVSSRGRAGGLALLWNNNNKVDLKSFSHWHIDVWVRCANGSIPWQLTGFYGYPEEAMRSNSWSLLRRLCERGASPWLCLGDFNELRASHEKVGGPDKPPRLMAAFNSVIEDCQLRELKWTGPKMTWSRGKEGRPIVLERLDRALANASWFQMFDRPVEEHLVERRSDHLPLLIHCAGMIIPKRVEKRFRFENMWIRDADCAKVIEDSWMGRDLLAKIQSCSGALEFWNERKYGNLQNKIRDTQKQLKEALMKGDNGVGLEDIQKLQGSLDELLCQEEVLWCQRSKQLWLREGEKSTSFFHSTATKRKQTNVIAQLVDEFGELKLQQHELESIAACYFKNLFSPCCNEEAVTRVTSLLSARVSEDTIALLSAPYSPDEIKAALDAMEPSKSPGPDGLNACFFRKHWHIVGTDVVNAVLAILNSEESVADINETFIVLIPKVPSPTRMMEFRPISLCNIVYKLVAKVLANRLQTCLPHIISTSQSAFVSGRSIYDNSIVAQELVHTMQRHKQGENGEVALKLDMSKAFDRVEWLYLERVMLALGFPGSFVSKIMECVRTVRYAVLVNGRPSESVVPGRGIRQGDPLSPYLFILCVEGFSKLLEAAGEEGRMLGVAASEGGPRVSHLFFADDSLVFMQALDRDCEAMRGVLNCYEQASGQYINLAKSAIFFSANVKPRQREKFMNLLGVTRILGSEKYLGLPLMFGRSMKNEFQSIKERIGARLQTWNGKLLSQHGKGVLIRSILQAIPTYTMGCFKLPMSLIKDINSMVAHFWWGGKKDKRKIHWLAWDKLCCSKMEGGQGFKDLVAFNKAMLARTWWRLLQDDTLLAHQVLKAKYCGSAPLRYAMVGNKCSNLWKSLMAGREVIDEGAYFRVGNGEDINVWRDKWVRDAFNCRPIWAGNGLPIDRKVSMLIDSQTGQWRSDVLNKLFTKDDVDRILRIPLSCNGGKDRLIWKETPSGEFTVRSGYVIARKTIGSPVINREERDPKWKIIFSSKVAPRVQHFLWRVVHNICPTVVVLRRRGLATDGGCPVCHDEDEDIFHVLFSCPLSVDVWRGLCSHARDKALELSTSDNFWGDWLREMSRANLLELSMVTCWSLWKNRNKALHNDQSATSSVLQTLAMDYWKNYAEANAISGPSMSSSVPPAEWKAPRPGWAKINVDAAVDKVTGVAKAAAVARDSEGVVIFSAAKHLPFSTSVLHAELQAILLGLTVAREKVHQPIIVESDALLAVREIKKGESSFSPWGAILHDIHIAKGAFSLCVFQHVPRLANTLAHNLAHWFNESEVSCIWESLPNQL